MLEGGLEEVAATEKVVATVVLPSEDQPLPLDLGFFDVLPELGELEPFPLPRRLLGFSELFLRSRTLLLFILSSTSIGLPDNKGANIPAGMGCEYKCALLR
jgi:hypothetical protein